MYRYIRLVTKQFNITQANNKQESTRVWQLERFFSNLNLQQSAFYFFGSIQANIHDQTAQIKQAVNYWEYRSSFINVLKSFFHLLVIHFYFVYQDYDALCFLYSMVRVELEAFLLTSVQLSPPLEVEL